MLFLYTKGLLLSFWRGRRGRDGWLGGFCGRLWVEIGSRSFIVWVFIFGAVGSGLFYTVFYLIGVNVIFGVVGVEYFGFDLVFVEVGVVVDVIVDYGYSGFLEYFSLLVWGCGGKVG